MDQPPSAAGARRATIVTLSQAAGVAPSTVSRALKGDTRISPETRARIGRLAKELGYTPHASARTLSSGRSGLIGVVIGASANPFYTELLHEAVAQVAPLGMRLLIIHAGPGMIENSTADALLQYQVDGCLMTSVELPSHVAAVCASTSSSTGQERERGFVQEIEAAGCEHPLRLDGRSTYEGGFDAAVHLAGLPAADRPEAIFAVSDIMAHGLLDGLRISGIRVPQDIAVVGFDGLPASARPLYDLTTVEQPLKAMISRALGMLRARIEQPAIPDETVSLRGRLIIRGSSAAVAAPAGR
jgi:DNA-binding LacI/PurR family transcriptional regulator